jgi:hypothetical protein
MLPDFHGACFFYSFSSLLGWLIKNPQIDRSGLAPLFLLVFIEKFNKNHIKDNSWVLLLIFKFTSRSFAP